MKIWLLSAVLLGIVGTGNSFALTLSGTVSGGSFPMANAVVSLHDATSSSKVFEVATNAQGQYSFAVTEGTYNLVIAPPAGSGYASSVVNGVAVTFTSVVRDVVLVTTSKRLSGVITTFEGAPVANARLRAYGPQDITVTTDAEGRYSFELMPGYYRLIIYDINSSVIPNLNGNWYTESFVESVNLSVDTVINASLPQFHTIQGRVTDTNGAPVSGVGVNIVSSNYGGPSGALNADLTSDANGYFTAYAPAGTGYRAILNPPPAGSFVQTTVGFSVSGDLSRDFALQTKKRLSGVITTFEGAPVANARVRAYGPQDITVSTDAAGRYELYLTPGSYRLILYEINSSVIPNLNGNWYTESFVDSVDVSADVVKDASLPQFHTIQGRVTDSNGAPVSGVAVEIRSSNYASSAGALSATFTSDANGRFTAYAPAATGYSAILNPPAAGIFVQTTVGFAVSGDLNRDFALQTKKRLSGVITTFEGVPVANARIRAYGPQDITVSTDAAGRYEFYLTPGSYRLIIYDIDSSVIENLNGSWYTESFVDSVDVSADVVKDASLPQFHTIQGRVTDGNGVPVGGVAVQIRSSNYGSLAGALNASFTSDASGNFTARATAAGGYSLLLTPGPSSGFSMTNSPFSVSGDKQISIILPFTDTTAPKVISGPTVRAVTDASAVIEWETNEPAHGGVAYGVSGASPGPVAETQGFRTLHSQIISGLTPGTSYSVSVFASDQTGNGPSAGTPVSFQTKPLPDTKAPVILEGPVVTSITDNGAVVEWRTDKPSTGIVLYGTAPTPGLTANDGATATSHRVVLSGMAANTLYYLQLSATDALGNGPTSSALLSFNTKPTPDVAPPVIVEGPMAIDITDTGATVVWKTDEPAGSGLSWNDGTVYDLITSETMTMEHSVRLTGLTAGTSYSFTASSKDAAGNGPTLSLTRTFTTLPTIDTMPPVITDGPLVINVTHQSAVIRWQTDEPANGVIEFGLSAAFGSSESHAALRQHHNMTLTGLEPGTLYHYRVTSKDAAGNGPTTSAAGTFTTAATADDSSPTVTREPVIVHRTDTEAVIAWETDKPSDTVVEYDASGGGKYRASQAEKVQKHQITMTNLSANTTYNVSISSTDAGGRTVSAKAGKPVTFLALGEVTSDAGTGISAKVGFMTNSLPDTTAPVIAAAPSVTGIGSDRATVTWSTDEISDSQIFFGTTADNLILSAGSIEQIGSHRLVLTKLKANTTYYYRVQSSDLSSNGPAKSALLSFTTTGEAFAKPGDCDGSGQVSIAEVQSAINMYLGLRAAVACVSLDGNDSVSISEVQKVINSYLGL